MNILILGENNDVEFVQHILQKDYDITTIITGNLPLDVAILNRQALSSYNCIVIAIKDKERSNRMYHLLEAILGYDSNKLLNFYFWYHASVPAMTVERVMTNPMKLQYDGIILGISHAEVGILPQLLNGSFCNLAVSSQDIYYNMKSLEYCIAYYPDKIRNLQYLIFDMFDYTYFNYDVSLSRTAGTYYNYGGFVLDAHKFLENKNYSWNFDELLSVVSTRRRRDTNEAQEHLWNEVFENVHIYNNYSEYENYLNLCSRTRIVTDEEIEEYAADTSIVKKIFHNTIHDNIQYFYRLLNIAYSLNPALKLFCILMPRYSIAQEKTKSAYAPWKDMFYTIIEESQKIYPFTFLDFKDDKISKMKECYFDVSHFNYYGAIQFTQLLNSLIFS